MAECPAIVLCTAPDEATAERLAGALVESHLAACVSLLPGARSIYEWEGRIERETEVLMVIKTDGARYPALARRLEEDHPYEVPEILRLDVADGLPAYLAWMADWLRNEQ